MPSAFLKPIESTLLERGVPDDVRHVFRSAPPGYVCGQYRGWSARSERFYYLAWVPKGITKQMARRKVAINKDPDGLSVHSYTALWMTKEEVDKFPKHLRRGGGYGHDPVRLVLLPARGEARGWAPGVWQREQRAVHEHNKRLCKQFGLKFEVVDQTN